MFSPYPIRRLSPLGSFLGTAAMCFLLSACGAGTSQVSQPDANNPAFRAQLVSSFAMLRTPSHRASRAIETRIPQKGPVAVSAHRGSTPNGAIWLVASARGELCLFAGDPLENSCEPQSFAIQHGITLGIIEDPADPSKRVFVLYGVVPDGQTSVRVKVGDQAPRSVPVRKGAFSLRAREPVVKL